MSSTAPKSSHQRTQSSASTKPTPQPSKAASPDATVHYTAIIRLPFPRNDFEDPAPIDWDAKKDRALWKIISRNSKTSDLDWEDLANRFDVDAGFMLQQAAWLYERHLQHVRAQMRKIQPPLAGAGSTANVSSTAGGYPMKRLGSGGSRAPSSMSVRPQDSPVLRDGSGPGTPRTRGMIAYTLHRAWLIRLIDRASIISNHERKYRHSSSRCIQSEAASIQIKSTCKRDR